jgi:hypothetical protein
MGRARAVVAATVSSALGALVALGACVADLPAGSPPPLDASKGGDAIVEASSDDVTSHDGASADGESEAGFDAGADTQVEDSALPWESSYDGHVASCTLVARGQICQSSGSCNVTLPDASAPGDLVVLVLAVGGGGTPAQMGSWVEAAHASSTGETVSIWYDTSLAGGVASVPVMTGTNEAVRGVLTEWNGPSGLDVTGQASLMNDVSLTVSTSHPAFAGCAVSAFGEKIGDASTISYATGTSWANLANNEGSMTVFHFNSDYEIMPPLGVSASETVQTPGTSTNWVGVIATFR